ncbi:putative lipoprotein [Burkholderia sp. H160]|nr:putative lipoprotein [Burkholderia sp. H160]
MKHMLSLVLAVVAGSAALTGCSIDPPGPAPILSRLPPDQAEAAAQAQTLTPEERARYDAIEQQVMFEQDQAIAADAAAQAWQRYYSPRPPVRFSAGFGSGGWGRSGWGTGIGVGFGPYWGW